MNQNIDDRTCVRFVDNLNRDFFKYRLPAIQARLQNWWEFGEQKNPCLLITIASLKTAAIPDTNDLEKWWMDIDFIIDRQMKVMDSQTYYGVAVPCHYIDRGSSAMCGLLGARMEFVDKETIWAYPNLESVEQVAEIILDRKDDHYLRALEITRRSVALAEGHHYVSHIALEGVTDILAGLYGTENLLMDLVSKPNEVARALENVKRIWIDLFNEEEALFARTGNVGRIGWAGIWAPGSHFPLQEDFTYMISNAMYRKYVIPHLRDQIDAMQYPFYHLDGMGALNHLNSLLEIKPLRAIQWVPGSGKERIAQWYGVIERILRAGKSVECFARADEVDDLVQHVGARGLLINVEASKEEAERLVAKYGED